MTNLPNAIKLLSMTHLWRFTNCTVTGTDHSIVTHPIVWRIAIHLILLYLECVYCYLTSVMFVSGSLCGIHCSRDTSKIQLRHFLQKDARLSTIMTVGERSGNLGLDVLDKCMSPVIYTIVLVRHLPVL